MGKGNSDPTIIVMQQIAQESHKTMTMVDQIGNMVSTQGNMMTNLIGLCMLLNCMQVALLENMDEYTKSDVIKEYKDLCKKYGVKPLTGVSIFPEGEDLN